MAYDLHVFRGANWWDGTDNPITDEEMLGTEGITPVEQVSTSGQAGSTISLKSKSMYVYKDMNLILKKGILRTSIRDDADIESIRPLANKLGAVIQGDEGEFY